jgi:hypothetical protein
VVMHLLRQDGVLVETRKNDNVINSLSYIPPKTYSDILIVDFWGGRGGWDEGYTGGLSDKRSLSKFLGCAKANFISLRRYR